MPAVRCERRRLPPQRGCTDRARVEGLRSKLKRLAGRGWLSEEAGPGLFALPARTDGGGAPETG
jgi:hypothetical protein